MSARGRQPLRHRGCRAACPGPAGPGGRLVGRAERHGKAGGTGLEPRRPTPNQHPMRSLSRAGHVKPGPKQGGPPSKPEYSPMTDSAPVPRGKGEKHPGRGVKQYLKPRARKASERPPGRDGVPFVE